MKKKIWHDSIVAVYVPLWLEVPELIEWVPLPAPIGDEPEDDERRDAVIDMS